MRPAWSTGKAGIATRNPDSPDIGNQVITDQFSTGGPNYREFLYALTH